MRGLKTDATASVIREHALVRNIRRGGYLFDRDIDPTSRLEAAFAELLVTI